MSHASRIFALALLLLLGACAGAPLRFPVQDVVIPAQSSGGNICYAEVSERPPADFRRVSYEATASYVSQGPVSAPITVRFYGRSSPPEALCAPQGKDDLELSSATTLEPGTPRRLVAGEGARGETLAGLLRGERYWLGLSLEGGAPLSMGERIELKDGVIVASF